MKLHTAIAWFLLFSCLAFAQGQSNPQQPAGQPAAHQTVPAPAASPEHSKIDPAKEADIRRLLELAGTKALAVQTMDNMEKSIKPLMVSAFQPGEYREKLIDLFFEKFHSKSNPQVLLDLAVPLYDQHFSHEEVKGLIKFYETPLGQKMIETLPKLSAELQEAGRKWGEALGGESMREVLAEHPDLAKAVEDANKPAQPK